MTDKVFVDGDNHFTEDEILIIAKNHVKRLGRGVDLILRIKFCGGEQDCLGVLEMNTDFSYKFVVTTYSIAYTFNDEFKQLKFDTYAQVRDYLNGITKLHTEQLLAQATKTLNTLKSLGYY